MPASSMDQVTQGIMQLIMQLNPKNLPPWRFHYFWTTYSSTCLLAWLEKVLPFIQLGPRFLQFASTTSCSRQRSGFMHLLYNPFLGSARLLPAPSQPSLPSLSRSCSFSLFLHITGSRPRTLLVPLQFVKKCIVLGGQNWT